MRRLTILLLAAVCGSLIAAPPKAPRLRVLAVDDVTGLPLTGVQTNIFKITKDEKKGESFIFAVTVERSNYNTLKTSVPVAYALAGKVVVSTQRLEPMILGHLGKPNASGSSNASVLTNNASVTTSAPLPPPPVLGTVHGIVRNSDRSPLAGVSVRLIREDGSVRSEMMTGPDGAYSFTNLEKANFKVVLAGGREVSSRVIPLPARVQMPAPVLPLVPPVPEPSAPRIRFLVVPGLNRTIGVEFATTNGMAGALVGFKSPQGYLFATPAQTVMTDRSMSELVWKSRISLDGTRLSESAGRSLFEDGQEFDLYLFTVYGNGSVNPLPERVRVMTKDTVPPPLPVPGEFGIENGVLMLSWKRGGSDTEALSYRVYARTLTNDRLIFAGREYTTNRETRLTLPLPRDLDTGTNLVLAVTAVDRSGNESEWSEQTREFRTDGETVLDFVMERRNPQIEPPPPPPPPKPVRKPTPAERFIRAGYVLTGGPGVGLVFKSHNFWFRPEEGIRVKNGARLTIEHAVIGSAGDGRWKGIRVESGAMLVLKDCRIINAVSAIEVSESGRVVIENCIITNCKSGLLVKSSKVDVFKLKMSHCGESVRANSSVVTADSFSVESNTSGPVFLASEVRLSRGRIRGNETGLRITAGGAGLEDVRVTDSRSDGIVLEGCSAVLYKCEVSRNAGNGAACVPSAAGDPVFTKCDFDSNRHYAVRGGGRLSGCYVGRNNGAPGTDSTPDRGSPDGIRDSFSNASIMQIYGVDSVKSMSLKKILPEE
jgi:hypothetical protein